MGRCADILRPMRDRASTLPGGAGAVAPSRRRPVGRGPSSREPRHRSRRRLGTSRRLPRSVAEASRHLREAPPIGRGGASAPPGGSPDRRGGVSAPPGSSPDRSGRRCVISRKVSRSIASVFEEPREPPRSIASVFEELPQRPIRRAVRREQRRRAPPARRRSAWPPPARRANAGARRVTACRSGLPSCGTVRPSADRGA